MQLQLFMLLGQLRLALPRANHVSFLIRTATIVSGLTNNAQVNAHSAFRFQTHSTKANFNETSPLFFGRRSNCTYPFFILVGNYMHYQRDEMPQWAWLINAE